jgi:putative ABC transport system permease protein
MKSIIPDLKYAMRIFARTPGFAAAAVATMALGIGANTAIFSVVRGVLLKPLAYHRSDRIVDVAERDKAGRSMRVCDPNFGDLKARSHTFSALAEWASWPVSVAGGSEPVRVVAATVSADFFPALGVQPSIGRGFAAEELREGGAPAVLVSHSFWERFLSSDRDLSRVSLTFGGELYRVVGVMPPPFQFPQGAELWTPRERRPAEISRSAHNWHAVGRLRDDASLDAARADLSAIAARIKAENGDKADLAGVSVVPLRDALVGRVRPALLMLLCAVGFLMLVAGANLTNLLLARVASRGRELAVRTALGASRGDLMRLVLAETLLVAAAGAAVGLILSAWCLDAIRSLSGASLPRSGDITVDLPVLGFAASLALLSAVLVAAAASRRPAEARTAELAAARSAAPSRETVRSQQILLGVQAAVTAMLLAGLALFTRSFLSVLDVAPGFAVEGILAMDLFPPDVESDADKARRVQLLDRLLGRLGAIPGVEKVGAVGSLPLGSDIANGTLLVLEPGQPPPTTIPEFERLFKDPARTAVANYCPVTEGYFAAMKIPLVSGRLFEERDAPQGEPVAVVSSQLARRRWPDHDPIGATIEFGNMDGDTRPLTIIGVVGDVHQSSLEASPYPTVYVDFRQRPQAAFALTAVLRIAGDPAGVIAAARGTLQQIDPTLPPRFRTLDRVVADSLAARRFSLTLLAFFGGLALLLATAGIAGVTAFAVARRRGELGIRLALGATPGGVLRQVMAGQIKVVAIGAAFGLAAAALGARLLSTQLYGVAASDPWSLSASALALLAVGSLACLVPARQVIRIDPTEALRSE